MAAGLRSRLKQTRLFDVWRRVRRRQQLREFDRLLDRLTEPGEDVHVVSVPPSLRQWPDEGCPRIVGFGTTEWEVHGLWPAFERSADFVLWQYREAYRPSGLPDAAERSRTGRRFLEFVDARDSASTPVHAVFFYAAGTFISDELLSQLRHRGIRTVVMGLDDKHQFAGPSDADTGEPHQLRVARHCDLYWTTWRTGAALVARRGGRPWYAPEAADPQRHRPLDVRRDLDVVFVGQAYGERASLVEYLRRRGFNVTARGAGWPGGFVDFESTLNLYSRAQTVLGIGGVGHMQDVKHLKGRDFEVPMCGALYLTGFNPELTDFFDLGREILCYGSPQECADVLHWIRAHPAEADAIRRAARARSERDHTWEVRLAQLFEQLRHPPSTAALHGREVHAQ